MLNNVFFVLLVGTAFATFGVAPVQVSKPSLLHPLPSLTPHNTPHTTHNMPFMSLITRPRSPPTTAPSFMEPPVI